MNDNSATAMQGYRKTKVITAEMQGNADRRLMASEWHVLPIFSSLFHTPQIILLPMRIIGQVPIDLQYWEGGILRKVDDACVCSVPLRNGRWVWPA